MPMTVAAARAQIAAQIVDGADNSLTPSKLRQVLLDAVDALAYAAPLETYRMRGSWNAASGVFPSDAPLAGHVWIVSTAGTVDGVAFDADDQLLAVVDGASSTTYDGNWLKIDSQVTSAEIAAALGYTPADVADLSDHVADQDNPHSVTKVQIGLGNVPNVDVTPALAGYTLAEIKALDTTVITAAHRKDAGREGLFAWQTGNFSTHIAADTAEGFYVKADAIASSSGAWVRVDTRLNVRHFGADNTGALISDTAFGVARAVQVINDLPMYAPAGQYLFNSSLTIGDDYVLSGAGRDATELVFNGVDGFTASASVVTNRVSLSDFTMRQQGNWGANIKTGIFIQNVSYSRFARLKIMYHQYGIYMRRTNPGAGYLACYFNDFYDIYTFGCQYGITMADNGGTVNDCSIRNCMSEDNGQRSGGYGLDIEGVGHTVINYYGGLPGHTAAVRLGAAALRCTLIDIYGESATLAMVIKDDTAAGRNNVIIGVHADGVTTLVTRASSASNAVYIDAGTATNTLPDRSATINKASTSAVGNASYDYMDFSVAGIAVGDTAEIVPPSGWPAGLIRGTPVVSAGSVRLAYSNNSGGSLTPPTGDYTVLWQDRTP